MNRIYKVIWSKVKNQYVVVSELAHSNGKQSSTSKISSVRGSLRAMLAALMVAGGIFSFTPAVYAAQANEASVSVLSDGIFWLQNGDNSIVIDEGNFDTYFVGAVRQADGTYTINGQVVSDKNLYNINDEIGAFVVDNNVYTGEVLDQNSNTVLSMQQRTIVNEDGFYAGNGKGTYNTLSKDGLWVGGTKDGEGFHVDNDGNVRTTGNMMVDGAFSAADGNATIAEDGSTYIKTEKSQLMVNDNVAGMTSGNGSVSVSNNSATLSGAGSVVDAGLNGIILTERTGNNSVTVNQDGTTVNGNLNVENGDFSAANGNATIEEDGTTLIQAGSSQLIVNDDVAGMTSGNGSIAVSNNSAEIRGAGNLITADLNGITLTERTGNNSVTVNQDGTTVNGNLNVENGDFSAANGNATIAEDGTTQIQVGSSQLRVTNDVAGMSSGNGSVSVSNNSATISAAGNNLEIGLNGIVTNGAFTAKGTATFEKGADMNGQKITNVQAGEVSATSTDAVNGSQMFALEKRTGHIDHITTPEGTDYTTVEGTKFGNDGTITNVSDTFTVSTDGTTKINNVVIGNEDSSAINVGDRDFVVYDGGSFQAAGRNFIVNQQGEMTAPKATIDDVVIDNNEITGLKNTAWTPNTVDYSKSDKAATEAQLKTVSDEAEKHTTVQSGKNVTVQENTTTDGHLDYTVKLNDDITLGDVNGNNIHLDGTNGNVTATGNITTKTGEVKANTFANTNGSFKVDENGDISSVGDITSTGEIEANTFANTLETFAVDVDGNVTADDVTATGNITTETGKVKANTFANTGNTFSVNADGDVGAVDVTATGDIKGKTLANTNGSFKVDENGDISSVGDITSTGEIEANTFANNTETFAVDIDGNVTADNVTATGNITTETGKVKANTFANTGNTFSVNADGDVGAVDVTATGDIKGKTLANTNGSFKVDENGDISSVGDITSTGEIEANTFANTLETFAVDVDGNVTADDVTATGNITTETGEVKANTFANTGNTFSVNADGDVGAVDVTATGDIKGKTLANTNGSFKVDENGDISSVGDITSTGEIEANTFANTLETFAVDVDGNVTAESYKVGTATYIDSNGINANSKVISNVAQGQLGTDAVNKDQLDAVEGKIKTYSEGNGIDINDTNTISVQLKQDEQNLVVDSTGLSLNPNLNVTSVSAGGVTVGAGKITGLATASIVNDTDAANKEYVDTEIGKIDTTPYTEGNGIDIADKAISVQLKQDEQNLVVDSTGLSLNPNLNVTSVSAGGVTVGAGKITGLATASIVNDTDAANKEYVDTEIGKIDTASYTEGNGIDIADKAISVQLKQDEQNLVVDSTGLSLNPNLNVTSVSAGGVTVGAGKITGLATASIVNDTDAANKEYVDTEIGKIDTTPYTEGNGIDIADKAISVQLKQDEQNLVVDSTGLSLNPNLNVTSVSAGGVTVGAGKITGLATASIVNDTDAANKEYVDTEIGKIDTASYTEGNGIDIADKAISVQLKQDEQNLVVDSTGLSLNPNLNVTSVSAGGVTVGAGKITGLATASIVNDTDAANKEYVDTEIGKIDTASYTEGNGIDIADKAISVQLKQDEQNLVVDSTGLSLNPNLNVTSVSAGGVTVGAGKITGLVTASIVDNTDAANKEYVDTEIGKIDTTTYEAGNGIEIADGTTEDKKISVKAGDGITVDDGSVAIDLAENSNLTVDNGLSLAKDLTGLTSIETGTLTASGDVSAKNFVTTSGSVTAGGIVINENNSGKITGLTVNPTDDDDAVNKAYVDQFIDEDRGLAVQYDNVNKDQVTLGNILENKTTRITNLTEARLNADSTDAVTGQQLFATNEKVGEAKWSGTKFIDSADDLTEAAEKLDKGIGNLDFSTNHAILGTTNYASATQAISELDRNIGDLTPQEPQSYFTKGAKLTSVTNALDRLSHAIGPMQFDTTNNFIDNDANLSSAIDKLDENIGNALKNVGFRLDQNGKVSTDIDWGTNYAHGTTIVSAVKDLDNRVGVIEGKTAKTFSTMSASNISTLSALSNMDMSTANTLASISPNALKAVANLSAENTVISDSEPATDSTTNSVPSREPENGNTGITTTKDAVTVDRNVTVNGDTTLNGDLNVRDNVSVGGTFEVDGKSTFNDDVSIKGQLNMNNNVITGVANGKVSADSTEAINGSQLYAVEQKVDSNTAAINTVGNQVNRLSNRIDKVGAGAAALAALHPLDFDPDDKLSFAAGYGNYAGENAVAVGAFYQPNEDTMFSVGGTFGNDENMVNAGVSFKLGQKSNVSRSRVSMAKELVSLRDEVAQLKALMAHAGILPSNGQFDTSALFPDVPENHWAYEYVHELGRLGILEGYADGNFEGDRMMTRYEMAAIVYRAMQKGVNIDSRMLKEFEPELKLIRVDVVARDDDGNPTIERVRVNEDTQQA